VVSVSIDSSTPVTWAKNVVPRLATFVFNFVQLGLAIAYARNQRPEAIFLLVAFELGILIDCFWRGGNMRVWSTVGTVAALILLIDARPVTGASFMVSAMAVATFSLALKKIRTAADALGTVKKRWRAAGYLAAGLFAWQYAAPLMVTVWLILMLSPVQLRDHGLPEQFRLDRVRLRAYIVVMFHHVHYFVYAYFLVFLFLREWNVGAIWSGPLFYIGWLGYYVFCDATRHQRALVAGGHVIAGMAVLAMYWARALPMYLLLWAVTGLGGGTIVLLRELAGADNAAIYERFKTWEAFGHVVGVGCFAALVWWDMPRLTFVVGAFAAAVCALGAAVGGSASALPERAMREDISRGSR